LGQASPLFGAGAFDQQMIRFEEFGPEPMPTSAATRPTHDAPWPREPRRPR
jgi:hypothetical protein